MSDANWKLHPSGAGTAGMGALLLGSSRDPRPCVTSWGVTHLVAKHNDWENPNGVLLTDWVSECGLAGVKEGPAGMAFGDIHGSSREMLCRPCFGEYGRSRS